MPVVTIFHFGERWDAPMLDEEEGTFIARVDTPTDLCCSDCGEPFVEGDQGVLRPVVDLDDAQLPIVRRGAMHAECELSAVAGHQFGACGCTMPDATRRERAQATVAAIDAVRGRQGRGPWRVHQG